MISAPILYWFRKDLRLQDNESWQHAVMQQAAILPIYILDNTAPFSQFDSLPRKKHFLHACLQQLQQQLVEKGGQIHYMEGETLPVLLKTAAQTGAKRVIATGSPLREEKLVEQKLQEQLKQAGISLEYIPCHFPMAEKGLLKADGTAYQKFTPYYRQFLLALPSVSTHPQRTEAFQYWHWEKHPFTPKKQSLTLDKNYLAFPEISRWENYDKEKDHLFPSGSLAISPGLRKGIFSPKKIWSHAQQYSQYALKELIWSEFFITFARYYPECLHREWNPSLRNIQWSNNEKWFEQWQNGETGFPLIDAGMRQLKTEGFMPNRVRMLCASFLCKQLLIDWKWGEAWFAEQLIDYDPAINNGNWQWCAGTGVDAAPYFRIFNPQIQQKKFDPYCTYISQYIDVKKYKLKPIIDPQHTKERVLAAYKRSFG